MHTFKLNFFPLLTRHLKRPNFIQANANLRARLLILSLAIFQFFVA
ncbi:hypothetical protein HPHPH42_1227 [Helicobacter pylori Hp H-42]|uniref:Uncharacterized protein n=1 Tax=Helicobacter pylori Hp H-42 TaxID=992047 RepID=A0AB33XGB7_HELPX|nr:hypothetical protein HPHPH42_1227 [Helicobacter pylori Hp H-42]